MRSHGKKQGRDTKRGRCGGQHPRRLEQRWRGSGVRRAADAAPILTDGRNPDISRFPPRLTSAEAAPAPPSSPHPYCALRQKQRSPRRMRRRSRPRERAPTLAARVFRRREPPFWPYGKKTMSKAVLRDVPASASVVARCLGDIDWRPAGSTPRVGVHPSSCHCSIPDLPRGLRLHATRGGASVAIKSATIGQKMHVDGTASNGRY